MTCSMIGGRRIVQRSKVYESWARAGLLDVMNCEISSLEAMSLINGSTLNSLRLILRPSASLRLWDLRALTFPWCCFRMDQSFWKARQLTSPRKWGYAPERKRAFTTWQSSAGDLLA